MIAAVTISLPYLTVTVINMLIDDVITPRTIRYLSEFTSLEIQASHRSAHPALTQREDNTDRCVAAVCVRPVSPHYK